MASAGKPPLEDARRTTGSPKMKSRGECDSELRLASHFHYRSEMGKPEINTEFETDGVADNNDFA